MATHFAPVYHYRPRVHWRITVNTKPYYPKTPKAPRAAKAAPTVHAPAAKALAKGSRPSPLPELVAGCRMPDAGCPLPLIGTLPPARQLALPNYAVKISLDAPPAHARIDYRPLPLWPAFAIAVILAGIFLRISR